MRRNRITEETVSFRGDGDHRLFRSLRGTARPLPQNVVGNSASQTPRGAARPKEKRRAREWIKEKTIWRLSARPGAWRMALLCGALLTALLLGAGCASDTAATAAVSTIAPTGTETASVSTVAPTGTETVVEWEPASTPEAALPAQEAGTASVTADTPAQTDTTDTAQGAIAGADPTETEEPKTDTETALTAPALDETDPDCVEIWVISVGKGDAILIKTGGRRFLIDGGKTRDTGKILSVLREEGVTRLDAVFLTHTDNDHIGCLPYLAEAGITVGAWYAPRYYASPKKEKNHPAVTAAALTGQKVTWLEAGDKAEGLFTVLAPEREREDEDDNSLVMLLETAYGRVLLAGDMEEEEEEALLFSGAELRCDVLKVPNHGDEDAASDAFIQRTGATVALISTSPEEKPGTPCDRVLAALAEAETAVYRTDACAKGIRVLLAETGITAAYRDWDTPLDEEGGTPIISDGNTDTITLYNAGETDIDLSGWTLLTEKNEKLFLFPEGATLPAGETLTVGNTAGCDFLWEEKNILRKKKEDSVTLYTSHGAVADTFLWEP